MILVLIVPVSADGTIAGEQGYNHGHQAGTEGTPEAYFDNPYDPETNETEYYDYVMGYAAGWIESFAQLLINLRAEGETAGRVAGFEDGVAPVSYNDTVTEFPDRCGTIEAQITYQAGFSTGYELRFNEGRLEWETNSLNAGKNAGYGDGINKCPYNCVLPAEHTHVQAYESGYATGYSNAEDEILQQAQAEVEEDAIRASIRAGKDAGYNDGINGRAYNCVAPENEPNKESWEYGYHMRHNAGLAKYQNALTAANQNIIPIATIVPTESSNNSTNETNITNITNTAVVVIDVIEDEPKSFIRKAINFLKDVFSFNLGNRLK